MVQKKMMGRLGNQFFQYAAVRAYLLEHHIDDTIGFNFDLVGDGTNGFCDSLQNFKVTSYQTISKLHYTTSQTIILFFLKGIEKLIMASPKKEKREYNLYQFEKRVQPFLNTFGIFWVMNGYVKLGEARYNQHNLIFHGFFESPAYFSSIRPLLLQELEPKDSLRPEIMELVSELKRIPTICISIRRGDFITNDRFKKIHFLCDEEYFEKAIAKMNELCPNARYFVCSDDITWCQEHMHFPEHTLFEQEHNTLIEKIILMSACQHFILSNSTFSWWVQYLSRNPQKIVLAPSKWRNFDYTLGKQNNDIYESNWIQIERG